MAVHTGIAPREIEATHPLVLNEMLKLLMGEQGDDGKEIAAAAEAARLAERVRRFTG